MGKSFALILILIMVISSLTLMGVSPFVKAQTGTNVSSRVINQDATWTKAGSPYTFMGPVDIANGVTLTIDAGAIVNLGSYYLEVNGTLQALGTSTDQVYFKNGIGENIYGDYPIMFISFSRGWNEQTGEGCIIENAVLNSTSILINSSSPEIRGNTIQGSIITQGNGIITIVNNTINGGIEDSSTVATVIINNTITSGGIFTRDHNSITICDNTISGALTGNAGMDVGFTAGVVSDNVISDCNIGIWTQGPSPIIERNLITRCTKYGLLLNAQSTIAQNNTVTNCAIGIAMYNAFPTVIHNNIYANSQYNFKSGSQDNGNVPDNWWGTANQQAINQTIYDSKDDFNIGKVNFIPFLTAPNPEAMPNPNAPVPLPNIQSTAEPTSQPPASASSSSKSLTLPSSSAAPSASSLSLSLITTIALVVIAFLLAVIIALLLYMRKQNRLMSVAKKDEVNG
jgi:hypothetical protein